MSYPGYGRGGMRGGYGPPGGGGPMLNSYYPPPPPGGPGGPRHPGPPYGHGHPDYDGGPPPMRGDYGSPMMGHHDESPRGGYGRGYPADPRKQQMRPSPVPLRSSDAEGDGSMSGSGFEFESETLADDPRFKASIGKEYARDCEIVVLNKAQQHYADMIEKHIKELGLSADQIFPKGDVSQNEYLRPIAKMGAIFAIIVDSDNEMNRSVHFYQFRGVPKPQYHKNVPVQRAYKVIETKYRELREKEIGRTPPEVKNLLKTLCDEKMIKDDDYPRLIKYLHDRRRKQRSFYQRTNNIIPDFKNEIDLVFDTPEGRTLHQRVLDVIENCQQ